MSDLAQLHFVVPSATAEAVASLLTEDGGGIEQRDGETLVVASPGVTELLVWMPASQVARKVKQVETLLGSLKAMGTETEPWSWRTEEVKADAWHEAYKKFFSVSRVGRQFVIKPSWELFDPEPRDLMIELDPGMAFGTGLHASTRLALSAIARVARTGPPPQRVLDLGTGTGILAIAAARMWEGCEVLAVDNDELAVEICRSNVARNGLSGQVRVEQLSAKAVKGSFNLVLANLSRDLLLELQPRARSYLEDFGRVIFSGMLVSDAITVARSYAADLVLEPEYSEDEDGWRALILRVRP